MSSTKHQVAILLLVVTTCLTAQEISRSFSGWSLFVQTVSMGFVTAMIGVVFGFWIRKPIVIVLKGLGDRRIRRDRLIGLLTPWFSVFFLVLSPLWNQYGPLWVITSAVVIATVCSATFWSVSIVVAVIRIRGTIALGRVQRIHTAFRTPGH